MGRWTRTTLTVISATVALAATFLVTATPAAATQSSTTTTTASTTDDTERYCEVTFTALGQWQTGYLAGLSVRNISTVPVRWQLLRVWFPGPVLGGQFWNATVTISGSMLTVIPSPYTPSSGVLAPGETRMIGMVQGSGPFIPPTQSEVTCTPALLYLTTPER